MRKNVGVAVLALSVLYSAIDLLGWLRPSLIRMRAHGGWERTVALVAGSLFLKGVVLLAGLLLAFWPDRSSVDAR
jgi:hypothetical protein